MGLFCALLVVLHHFAVQADDPFSSLGLFHVLLGQSPHCVQGGGLVYIAVPFFFVCSGYFAETRINCQNWYRALVIGRIKSVLLPYVIWIAISIIFMCMYDWLSSRQLYFGDISSLIKGSGLYLPRIENPVASQLWYLRSLFMFILLSPVIRRLTNVFGLALMFVAYAVISPFDNGVANDVFRYGLPLEGLFFFALGMRFRFRPLEVRSPKKLGVMLSLGAGILLFTRYVLVVNGYSVSLYVDWAATLLLLPAIWMLMPCGQLPTTVYRFQFPIFVLHRYVLLPLGGLFRHCPCVEGWNKYALIMSLSILIPATITLGLKRIPRMGSVMFGGRV